VRSGEPAQAWQAGSILTRLSQRRVESGGVAVATGPARLSDCWSVPRWHARLKTGATSGPPDEHLVCVELPSRPRPRKPVLSNFHCQQWKFVLISMPVRCEMRLFFSDTKVPAESSTQTPRKEMLSPSCLLSARSVHRPLPITKRADEGQAQRRYLNGRLSYSRRGAMDTSLRNYAHSRKPVPCSLCKRVPPVSPALPP
jgi:hypothetical protein